MTTYHPPPLQFDRDLSALLTPQQKKRAKEAARDLASKAAKQHTECVEWSREQLKPFVCTDNCLVVLTRQEPNYGDGVVSCHVSSLAEEDKDQNVVEHHLEIAVTTTCRWEGGAVCYRTRTDGVVDDVIAELRHDQVVGAVIAE